MVVPEQAEIASSIRSHNRVSIDAGGQRQADARARFSIFAAMPFLPSFDDVFFVAMCTAAKDVGGVAVRVDRIMHGDDAVLATERELRRCKAVIADVSTSEPDVLYELGMAHALGKPTVQICRTEFAQLPFMIRNRETLLYEEGRVHLLTERLSIYLGHILTR